MKRFAWIAAVLAALTLVAGCHGSHNQNSTDMRSLNAVPDSEPLDILVDSDVKAGALALGAVSSLAEFSSGSHDVQIRSSTNQTILVDKTLSFSSGVNSTLLVFGKRAAINLLLLADDTTTQLPSGDFGLRAVNLGPDAGAVDVYVTTASVNASTATLSGVAYGSATASAQGVAGTYTLYVTSSGTKDVLFQSPTTVQLAAGTLYTLALTPAPGGKLLNAVLMTTSSSTNMANPFGRVKAVNGIADSGNLNYKVDGNTILSSVPFTGTSSYVTTTTGTHNIQIEPSSAPGSVIASFSQQIAAAQDYTALSLGTIAAPRLAVFADDNSLPAAGFAKVRFVNTLPSTTVDALINFASQAAGLAPGTASSYYSVAAATDYTITFTTAGGVTILVTLTPVELDSPGVYTVYLFGSAGTPTGKVVRDR